MQLRGAAGMAVPQVEGAIALSVIMLGIAIVVERPWPLAAAVALVGFAKWGAARAHARSGRRRGNCGCRRRTIHRGHPTREPMGTFSAPIVTRAERRVGK